MFKDVNYALKGLKRIYCTYFNVYLRIKKKKMKSVFHNPPAFRSPNPNIPGGNAVQ